MANHVTNPQIREAVRETGIAPLEFAPLAADPNYFMTSVNPVANVGGTSTTTIAVTGEDEDLIALIAPGNHPVVPVLTIAEAVGDTFTSVSVTSTVVDQFGLIQVRTNAGVNSSGTWTVTLDDAVLSVSEFVITITGTADAAADTIVIGFVKTYGIGSRINASTDVKQSLFDGAADAGTVDIDYSTYLVAGTPDATKLLSLYTIPTLR